MHTVTEAQHPEAEATGDTQPAEHTVEEQDDFTWPPDIPTTADSTYSIYRLNNDCWEIAIEFRPDFIPNFGGTHVDEQANFELHVIIAGDRGPLDRAPKFGAGTRLRLCPIGGDRLWYVFVIEAPPIDMTEAHSFLLAAGDKFSIQAGRAGRWEIEMAQESPSPPQEVKQARDYIRTRGTKQRQLRGMPPTGSPSQAASSSDPPPQQLHSHPQTTALHHSTAASSTDPQPRDEQGEHNAEAHPQQPQTFYGPPRTKAQNQAPEPKQQDRNPLQDGRTLRRGQPDRKPGSPPTAPPEDPHFYPQARDRRNLGGRANPEPSPTPSPPPTGPDPDDDTTAMMQTAPAAHKRQHEAQHSETSPSTARGNIPQQPGAVTAEPAPQQLRLAEHVPNGGTIVAVADCALADLLMDSEAEQHLDMCIEQLLGLSHGMGEQRPPKRRRQTMTARQAVVQLSDLARLQLTERGRPVTVADLTPCLDAVVRWLQRITGETLSDTNMPDLMATLRRVLQAIGGGTVTLDHWRQLLDVGDSLRSLFDITEGDRTGESVLTEVGGIPPGEYALIFEQIA
ncbi:unnamed protein product, partial [Symbiodinium sp. CCMP2456]